MPRSRRCVPVKGRINNAMKFVLLLGAVSLFADMTYEAARSVTGQYLAILGAGAATVGVVSGLGEFIGYGFRIVSGLVTDHTHRYWPITIAGYVINLLAVPALGLTHNWPAAAALIIMERFGKAVRNPARDAMLSHASHEMGRGWGFGVHEAMDQVGAIVGPMIVAAVLAWKGSYRYGFAVLAIPAVLALSVLVVARVTYPNPRSLEPGLDTGQAEKLSRAFWLYLVSAAFIALGFADFPLAAFHMKTGGIVSDEWIPIIYSGAMGVDALSALVLGRLYDRKGIIVLLFAIAISALSAPLVYLSGAGLLIAGMALWGIGIGAQESIVRAVVSDITPADRRATAYGVFNAGYGLAWFIGSSLMGLLYARSIVGMVVFSAAAQLLSLPLLLALRSRLTAPG
jgi:MFS family permease